MSFASDSIQRFQQMSRAMQWATLAVIGILLFLVWDQAIAPTTADLNKKADHIKACVREIRANEVISDKLKRQETRSLVTTLGPVRSPTSIVEGGKMFNDTVNETLQKHGVPNCPVSSRSRATLPKTALFEITQGNKRVDRLTGDLKFDATPKNAVAIIADLESSPYIESINSVRLIRDTGGKVKVHLTIEAWVLSSNTKGTGS